MVLGASAGNRVTPADNAGVHRGLPLWAFRFLAARQGSRLSVREPTDLCIRRAWACLPVGKGGEEMGRDGGKGKLGGGRLVGWVRALACYGYAAP